jgi:sialidase-1
MSGIRQWVLSGVLLAAFSSNAATLDNDPHLVGWWKFDEIVGKSAADSSKGKHNGVLEGDLAFDKCSVSGRIGSALKFDGAKDSVRITGYKGVTGTQPRTIAVWIKTAATTGEVVSWGLDDHGKMWTLGFIRGRIGVTPKGGYLYMKDSTSDDAWHHVAAVVLEASPPNLHDNAKIYKDGEPAEIHDIGLLDLWPIETGDKLDVTIGRKFKGAIDDLRIYDRALSDDEIKALFKAGGK